MKNLLLLLILVSSTTVTIGQDFDESLQRACEVMGDHYKKREHRKSVEGDKCELKFKVATRDDEDARQFCELNAPWRLIKVERTQDADRHFTICHVEATLMCQPGWVQMFGHCFKMPNKKKVATREEAVNMCKEAHPDADIAFMHHRYIVGVWKNYFRGLKQIWVRATESWDKYIQKTDTVDGDSLALAFSGKHFRFSVFYNSLIKILPDIRLQVLCEYKPPITNAEINFLGKRYSEIYYPVVTVKTGILVRSASSYTGSADILDICKKSLLPYKTDTVGPFVPDQEVLDEMSRLSLPSVVLTRAGAEGRLHESVKSNVTCQEVANRFLVKSGNVSVADYFVKDFKDAKIECDNMLSAGISFLGEKPKFVVMSESRSLPVWCKLGLPKTTTYSVPAGYTPFFRNKGDIVAHKYYPGPANYDEASKQCKKDGSFLSGINELKEVEFLKSIAQCKNCQPWLGGLRRKDCEDKPSKDGTICTRVNSITWQDGVATEFFLDWWRNGNDGHTNPSSGTGGGLQACLTFIVGTPSWADEDSSRFLDDMGCEYKNPFFCMKRLNVTVEN